MRKDRMAGIRNAVICVLLALPMSVPARAYAGPRDITPVGGAAHVDVSRWTSAGGTTVRTEADDHAVVRKTVIPTETDGEFLVHLAVDVEDVVGNFFEKAEYCASTSNGYKNLKVGSYTTEKKGSFDVHVSADPGQPYVYSALFDVYDDSNNLIMPDLKLWWDGRENVTLLVNTGIDESGQEGFVILATDVSSGTTGNRLKMTKQAMDAIEKQFMEKIVMESVLDKVVEKAVADAVGEIGELVALDDAMFMAGDYKQITTDGSSIGWDPAMKPDMKGTSYEEEVDGRTVHRTSYENAAELVYRVSMDPPDVGTRLVEEKVDPVRFAKSVYVENTDAFTTVDVRVRAFAPSDCEISYDGQGEWQDGGDGWMYFYGVAPGERTSPNLDILAPLSWPEDHEYSEDGAGRDFNVIVAYEAVPAGRWDRE